MHGNAVEVSAYLTGKETKHLDARRHSTYAIMEFCGFIVSITMTNNRAPHL